MYLTALKHKGPPGEVGVEKLNLEKSTFCHKVHIGDYIDFTYFSGTEQKFLGVLISWKPR